MKTIGQIKREIANFSTTPSLNAQLKEAIDRDDWRAVKKLIAAGADVNGRQDSWGDRWKEEVRSPLWYAVEHGKTAIAKYLIEAGADVNEVKDGCPLIVKAAYRDGDEKLMALLVKAGADVNAQNSKGETALIAASSRYDKTPTVDYLLNYAGADPNIKEDEDGWTALMKAAWNDYGKTIKVLCKNRKTDIDAKDNHGDTALIVAASRGHLDACQELIDAGADPDIRGSKGTAVQVANSLGHARTAKFLHYCGRRSKKARNRRDSRW